MALAWAVLWNCIVSRSAAPAAWQGPAALAGAMAVPLEVPAPWSLYARFGLEPAGDVIVPSVMAVHLMDDELP